MWPTEKQKERLIDYIENGGDFSIYGNNGIYSELEKLIAKRYGVKYCLLTNTGTSALSSGYYGINVQAGDEVIVPIYTFIATVTPLLRLGARPVFADVDPNKGQICPKSIERLITPRTKAVAVTHMWGYPCEIETIREICESKKIKLLEDGSHGHFTNLKGKFLGTFGDVGCFSVGAKKIVSGGEGGFLITNDEEVFLRAVLLGHFVKRASVELKSASKELREKYGDYTSGFGENYRMHTYAAVMLKEFIENELDEVLDIRYDTLALLNKELSKLENFGIPAIIRGSMFGYKPRLLLEEFEIDKLIDVFQKEGLSIKRTDTQPLYKDKIFSNGGFLDDYPGVKAYMRGRISIPNFVSKDRDGSIKKALNYINLFNTFLK